jgi:dTMP kinase
VILLTVPPEVTARRMGKRDLDRFEQTGDGFHDRVDAGFRKMAAEEPDRWVVVDASGPADQVTATIRDAVRDRLGL